MPRRVRCPGSWTPQTKYVDMNPEEREELFRDLENRAAMHFVFPRAALPEFTRTFHGPKITTFAFERDDDNIDFFVVMPGLRNYTRCDFGRAD